VFKVQQHGTKIDRKLADLAMGMKEWALSRV
jgi:hypothetical protein